MTRALVVGCHGQLGSDVVEVLQRDGAEVVGLDRPDIDIVDPESVAAAFAAATTQVPLSISALLVNLYDPIRLAEDIAVLDNLSGGRVSYTFGLGYRREEYDLFGASWETRGADIEEARERARSSAAALRVELT